MDELWLSEEKGISSNIKRSQKIKNTKTHLDRNMNKLDNFEGNIEIDIPEKILGFKHDSRREIIFGLNG